MKLVDLLEATSPDAQSGQLQNRVQAGTTNQQMVANDLVNRFGMEVTYIAPPSSTKPDIVGIINGQRVQFEVKGRQPGKWNSAFDVRVSSTGEIAHAKSQTNLDLVHKALQIITDGKFDDMVSHVEATRKGDPKYGLAGMPGVAASGKIDFNAQPRHLPELVNMMRANWHEKKDDYVASVVGDKITYYNITGKRLIPGARRTMRLTSAGIKTTSGASSSKELGPMTRIGLKFKFDD